MLELSHRRIVVTGAGSGNGRAIAIGLAGLGADVIVAELNEESGQQTVTKMTGPGSGEFCKLDVRDEAQVVEVLECAGPVDGLVNNAGILTRHRFLDMPVEAFDELISVNLRGYMLCAREAAKQMAKRRGGAIVNICSTNAHHGTAGLIHYGASKGGILQMTRGMALELAEFGIRVNSVSPGVIPTGLNADRLKDPAQVELSRSEIPLGRLGTPEDLVGIVALLLSDDASWITGADILVDGGELA